MRKPRVRLLLVAVATVASSFIAVAPSEADHGFPYPVEEPWLGLAKIQTDTGSGAHGRIYQFSYADVSAGTVGDREAWDYSPGTALTLRLEWYRYGSTNGATSAKVFLRTPGGPQIGTTVWQPTLPAGEDIGVVTTTIHLDDNPMDGIAAGVGNGMFEIYGQLVGGADDGADTRGAPAVGTIPGGGGHARGLFSNNGLKLYDHWNRTDGASWNSKWTTTSPTSTARVDVQGGRGRFYGSSTSRATSQTANTANDDVTLTYEFSDRNSGSDLRIYLRGSGASGTSQMPNGYRLDIDSGSTTVNLKKVVSGTATTIGSFTYNPDGQPGPDPGRHTVRFAVQGSTIKAKMWPFCSTSTPGGCWRSDEPSVWNLEGTNTAVTAPGKLQLAHYYNASGAARWVYVDDLFLSPPTTDFVALHDGFVRNDWNWDLGAPAAKENLYFYCENGRPECTYVGRTRFNAWVRLNGSRDTDRLEVQVDVLDGPPVRVEFWVDCYERAGTFTPGGFCGTRTWDTVGEGMSHNHNWSAPPDPENFHFAQADEYKLRFGYRLDPAAPQPEGETRTNPEYETEWIDCPKNNQPCKF